MYSKGGGGIVLAQSMPDESPDKFEILGLTPLIEQTKFETYIRINNAAVK